MDGGHQTLVERDHELRALATTAAAVAGGASRLVLVSGEAGIGKSRLAAAFEASLPSGWEVLRLGGHRASTDRRAPFEGLVESVAAEGGDAPQAVGAAFAAATRARAGGRPLAVVIEDLQLLDPVALEALPAALDGLEGIQALVLATYRVGSHPVGSRHALAVGRLLRHDRCFEMRLAPLSAAGVAAALSELGHPDPHGAAPELLVRTGGNPFFVEQLAAVEGTALPSTVAEVVVLRTAALSPSAQDLAALLAVAGAPLSEAVGQRLHARWVDDAHELREAGLALPVDDGLALRHALVAEAVAAALAEADRVRLHRALADAYEHALGSAPEPIATHWLAAGDTERAAPWCVLAADRLAARRADGTATELYRAALLYPPTDPADHAALLERAAICAALAGVDDAITWQRAAEEVAALTHDRWRANRLWTNPLLVQAAEGHAERTTGTSLLILDAQRAVTEERYDDARAVAALAHAKAVDDGDGGLQSMAALAAYYAGDVQVGLAWARDAVEVAVAAQDPAAELLALARLGRMHYGLGSVDEAVALGWRSAAAARRVPVPEVWGHVAMGVALVLAARGSLADVDPILAEASALDLPVLSVMVQAPLAMTLIDRGDPAAARRLLEDCESAARSSGMEMALVTILAELARACTELGEPARALEVLDEADKEMWSPVHEYRSDLLLQRALAGAALGDRLVVESVVERAGALALHTGGVGPLTVAETAAGLLAQAEGRQADAVAALERAAGLAEGATRWTWAADRWCDAAVCADAHRRRPALERAAALAEEHGLSRVAARIEAIAPGGPEAWQDPGPLALLTEREVDVVRLVATGRTNRQVGADLYLSELTVRNYLSSAMAKLGLARRTELAALLAGLPSA